MRDGFIKVAAATPKIQVADCAYNVQQIIALFEEGKEKHVKIMVFPELCLTGYTCGDLFLHGVLIEEAKKQLLAFKEYTLGSDMLVAIGFPMQYRQKLYNCAAWIQNGKILGIIPKTNLPNYAEFYEARYFAEGFQDVFLIPFGEEEVPFGTNQLFVCEEIEELIVGCEICEDLWVPLPPSTFHALAGATVIGNLSASDEVTGKETYRRALVNGQSVRLCCAYIYADAGEGESTSDLVYSGDNRISENGTEVVAAHRFTTGLTIGDIDVKRLSAERQKMTTFQTAEEKYFTVPFSMWLEETKIERNFSKTPFIPSNFLEREKRCEEIFMIQALGLKKRLEHTHCQYAILGISGGLDSTLALLVTVKAFDMLKIPREQIICITMPCYGTTDRTYQNAIDMTKQFGATLKEIRIAKAV